MDRRKTADVLFYALQCAKSDRTSHADAVEHDKDAYDEALADIRAFERLQVSLFGTSESELDSMTKGMKPVNILRLRELLETNPDGFIHSDRCDCNHCRNG